MRVLSEAAAHGRIREADKYLAARTGCYEWRCQRYDAALDAMYGLGLNDKATVVDVGSGWGEFGARMHEGRDVGAFRMSGTRARYIPVDACVDGTDLELWTPPRRADFFVCLEVVEHLDRPWRLLAAVCTAATAGVIVSTPNPDVVDVLAIDATHRTPVTADELRRLGFNVLPASFYGKPDDSLFAVWSPRFL